MKRIKLASIYDFDQKWKEKFPEFEFHYLKQPRNDFAKLLYALKINFGPYDVFLTEGTRLAFWIALVKCIFFNKRLKVFCRPRLLAPPRNPLKYFLEYFKVNTLNKGVHHFMVISTDEIALYFSNWGIPKEKMTFLPFKINDQEELDKLVISEGDHIYTGGDSLRDYRVFFAALKDLPVKAKVLSNKDFSEYDIPFNVEIVRNDGSTKEFYQHAASSLLAVFPIEPGHIRSAGQGTYLGCMYLKKPVIVSDTTGVRDLIDDNVSGIIVTPGDVKALKEKIIYLLANRKERLQMGINARERVSALYSHDTYIGNMFCRSKMIMSYLSKVKMSYFS